MTIHWLGIMREFHGTTTRSGLFSEESDPNLRPRPEFMLQHALVPPRKSSLKAGFPAVLPVPVVESDGSGTRSGKLPGGKRYKVHG